MRVVKLITPLDVYHSLHEAVEGKAKTVRVSADALRTLLVDHTRLMRELSQYKTIESPPPTKVRVRIKI